MLAGAIADEPVGTSFEAHRRKLSARKLWIAFASRVAGTVTVDDGARRALVERQTSLLPAGVVDVAGRFGEGDTVDVAGTDGVAFARGMVFVEAAAAAPGRRPPHQRPPARHGPRGHPPRRPRAAARLTSLQRELGSGGRRGCSAVAWLLDGGRRLAAAEAELGAQLAEAALGLDVGGGLLDLEHP